jgi:competence protein ComEA
MFYGFKGRAGTLLLILLAVYLASAIHAGADRLRVLSLNAQWFPGREPDAVPAQQARHIASLHPMLHDLDPDIWLVQEVNRAEALEKALAVLPDAHVYTVSAFTNGPHQLAIAGRLPVVSSGTAGWPVREGDVLPPRGIAYSVVEFSDGSVLPVFTLHLKSNFRGGEDYDEAGNIAMRETAARLFVGYAAALKATLADRTVRGMLLGGDFNVLYPMSLFRGERTSRILEEGGFSFLGSDGLDHFWAVGITNAVFSAGPEYKGVSDHRAVILDIALPEGVTIPRRPPLAPATVVAVVGNVKANVNSASLQELMALPGIGPVLAARIVLQRPYESIEELIQVCGIGPITLEQMQPWVEALPPDPVP